MDTYRFLEHTADMGIEATAASLEGLFVQAARALNEMIFGQELFGGSESLQIDVSGEDLGDLLVRWLTELLYLIETDYFVASRFMIDTLTPYRLQARVAGERLHPDNMHAVREVKAITYHRLDVTSSSRGWRAQVYVDL